MCISEQSLQITCHSGRCDRWRSSSSHGSIFGLNRHGLWRVSSEAEHRTGSYKFMWLVTIAWHILSLVFRFRLASDFGVDSRVPHLNADLQWRAPPQHGRVSYSHIALRPQCHGRRLFCGASPAHPRALAQFRRSPWAASPPPPRLSAAARRAVRLRAR